MKSDSRKRSINVKGIVKAVAVGTLAGAAMLFLLVVLGVYIVLKLHTVPYGAIVPMVMVTACIGSFFGGYLGARISRQYGLPIGALCGTMIFILMVAAGALSGGTLAATTLLRFLLTVTAGALGGIAGVNRRKRRK